jgi:intergrase/recombinase
MEPINTATKFEDHKSINDNKVIEFKTMGTKVKNTDIPILNQRLKIYGYQTIGKLIHDFIKAKFPPIYDDQELRSMKTNLQQNGQLTTLSGSYPSFLNNIDYDEMLKFFISNLGLHNKSARDLVSYFRRYYDIFFGNHPDEILKYAPHKRSWILQSMKKFAQYYKYKTGNPDCEDVVRKMIERYNLNISLDMKRAIYVVDDQYVVNKIHKLMEIQGEVGFIIKVGLFSGLREEEIIYSHSKEICPDNAGHKCDKMHVINKPNNGMSVITLNWFRGNKQCYFFIMPTNIWKQFRNLPRFTRKEEINSAHNIVKREVGIKFMDLRKLHYNVVRNTMDPNEADVLAGRAKTVSAQHYALYQLDKMTESYVHAWEKFGIRFS